VVAGPLSFLTGHLRARSWWYEIVALDVRLLIGGALTPVIQHTGRGLHSLTSQLNLSGFYGIGGARRRCVAHVKGLLGGI
jgi:hypothetical protein